MSDLNTLYDAFTELEHQADVARLAKDATTAADQTTLNLVTPERPERPRRLRLPRHVVAPLASAAAILAVVAGVAVWQASPAHHAAEAGAGNPTGTPSAVGPTLTAPPTPVPTTTRLPTTTAPASTGPTRTTVPAHGYQPPTTAAALLSKTQSILAGIATVQIDPNQSGGCDDPEPSWTVPPATSTAVPPVGGCSGAGLVGTLTSAGLTGGFNLNVYNANGDPALCDLGTGCTRRTLPDGSHLAIDVAHLSPASITYGINLVRPDGAGILLHVSNESNPKGDSPITAPRVPLTLKQMEAFVTSPKW